MKIRIRAQKLNLWIPVPLSMGGLAIRYGLKGKVDDHQRQLMLQAFKVCKHHLKAYRGMKIVEVHASTGEYISITV
jgi:hypothetical protein